MTELKSPAFKRNITSSRPLREFPAVGAEEVQNQHQMNYGPSPSFPPPGFDGPSSFDHQLQPQAPISLTPEELEAINQARAAKANPIVTPSAKKRFEYLADLGRVTKDVMINGHTFTLRTLKSWEISDVYGYVARTATNSVEEAFLYRLHSLAYALDKIDNQRLDILLDIKTYEDRLKFIDELENNLAYQLYLTYETLRQESNNQFGLKTEQDIKEVAEDLKK